MADKKISELPKINLISGSEVILPIVHDGTTQKQDVSTFAVFTSQWSATTGSNTFIGNQTITGNTSIGGNLTVAGKLTAQELFTEITSASILFESGSTIFGDTADDTHTITGTIILNGLALGTPELMAQTASQEAVNLGISSVTGSINTTTSSFNSVFQRISSTTGSINTTTSSFDSVFLGISSVTGALNEFTQSLNSLSGSFATTGSNTFRGNQSITGSLSVSAGEFNVTTGSGNMTSSLIFDHTQNDGVTLGLRHNDRLSLADHTFNVNVWAAGVYTTFVRNGTPYSILNVEAFDDNKIYLYRDTRLYNKSLVIDNNLTVQKGIVIGSGSLSIERGQFSAVTGSGALTSSLSFTHTEVDPITGDATLALRYRNNDVGPENNAWRFVATDNGVQVRYDQYTTSNKLLFSVSSFGSNFDKLLIWRDARLYGTGLTVDDSLLVKGVITGSLLSTNGVVSSSNQLFELNGQTGSQDLVNLGISSVTGSLIGITNTLMAFTAALDSTYATDAQLYQLYQATASIQFATASLNTQTGSQDLVNLGISTFTGSQNVINTSVDSHILKQATQTGSQDLVNLGISTYTGSQNVINTSVDSHILKQSTQTGSQDLVNLGISTFTGSLRSEVNLIEAYTASLKGAAIVSSSTQITNYHKFAETASANTFYGNQTISGSLNVTSSVNLSGSIVINGYTYPTFGFADGQHGVEVPTLGVNNVFSMEVPKTVYEYVKNDSGVTLLKGTPVHSTGTVGFNTLVIAASASNAATMPATFILAQDLDDEEEGLGIAIGAIQGVNTTGLTAGQPVYVGANGGWAQTKPTGSNLIQNIGIVTKVGNNGGGVVLGAGRSNDVPNIQEGYFWVGNSGSVATATPTSSFELSGRGVVSSSNQLPQIDGLQAYTASLKGAIEVSGQNVNVLGMITAQQFNVTYVSSSVMYQSGSTKLGNSSDDKHEITGSLNTSFGGNGGLFVNDGFQKTFTFPTGNLFSIDFGSAEGGGFIDVTYGGVITSIGGRGGATRYAISYKDATNAVATKVHGYGDDIVSASISATKVAIFSIAGDAVQSAKYQVNVSVNAVAADGSGNYDVIQYNRL